MPVSDVVAVGIVAVAAMFHGIFGFGYALVAVPLLTWLWGEAAAKQAVTFAVCSYMFQAVTMSPSVVRGTPWREVPLVLAGILAGLVAGMSIFHAISPEALTLVLGGALILMAWRELTGWVPRLGARWVHSKVFAVFMGLATGVIRALTAAGGPTLIIYGALRGWNAKTIKAFIQPLFFCGSVLQIALLAADGQVSSHILLLSLASGLPVVGMTVVGMRLADRVPHRWFDRLFYLFVFLMGALMVARYIHILLS